SGPGSPTPNCSGTVGTCRRGSASCRRTTRPYAARGIASIMPSAELRRTDLERGFRALFTRQRRKIAPGSNRHSLPLSVPRGSRARQSLGLKPVRLLRLYGLSSRPSSLLQSSSVVLLREEAQTKYAESIKYLTL